MADFFRNRLIVNIEKPYLNDYSRKFEAIASGLKTLISHEVKNKPLVVSVDAPWGSGKTTFIDMLGQDLINSNEIIAVKFCMEE